MWMVVIYANRVIETELAVKPLRCGNLDAKLGAQIGDMTQALSLIFVPADSGVFYVGR